MHSTNRIMYNIYCTTRAKNKQKIICISEITYCVSRWTLHHDHISGPSRAAGLSHCLSVSPNNNNINTHNCLTALCPGLPGWASTRKGKPIWILLKQDREWHGISWAVCKSAPLRSIQITTPAPHHSVFYRPNALPAAQPTASKQWRQTTTFGQNDWPN